jgi:hypothetical protein
MALTIWALLTSAAPDADAIESILVYGDDVIVPTAYAGSAIAILEEFGLKVNHSKSCTKGRFRESCGVDAFDGFNVTPIRLRTVWSHSPRPDVYTSWISYANSGYGSTNVDKINAEWGRQYYAFSEFIAERLMAIYGPIPDEDMSKSAYPSLRGISAEKHLFKRRFNKHLQKVQYKVLVVKSPSVTHEIDGWSQLLRYFTEAQRPASFPEGTSGGVSGLNDPMQPFSVSRYTKRGTSILVRRWR